MARVCNCLARPCSTEPKTTRRAYSRLPVPPVVIMLSFS